MLYPTDLLCLPAPKTSVSTSESPADPQAVRLAQLERELAETKQSLIQARDVIRSQQRKIQRLLPATPPPPARESDRVRFVTLRPTEPLQRLSGQQQIHDLLAAGWQIHSMTALPGDPPAVTVLLTHPDARPAPQTIARRIVRPRTASPRPTTALAGKSAPIVVDAHDETLTYAEALRAPRGAFTDAELAEIADREVHTAARRAYERAGDPTLSETLTRLNTRRSSDAARQ
ncbi:hypothetical protein [Aggregatilinea lenta]|uniref:hypothetical protein n=1 Tax=Aggregatilinea lenta TaxID=913108 RepID=UPI000E5A98E6|nr:hypothetical protein [Aggregatilinea lenta]